MSFSLRRNLLRRFAPLLLLLAVFANTSGHAYAHLADAPLPGADAHMGEQREGQTVYSSPHQCFICQSLYLQPLGKTAEFAWALPQDDAAVRRFAQLHLFSCVACPVAGRAPPHA